MIFNNKMKAITFSFDDGVEDDVRLIEIMECHGLRGTFNLNSGHLANNHSWRYQNVKDVRHLNYFDYPDLYKKHEVAGHSYNHPHLENLNRNSVDNQIRLDKKILEHLYECKIRGMAYPFGTYNEDVLETLRDNHIEYCRTVAATYDFSLPKEPLTWNPTCHFRDERIMELAEQFVNCEAEQDMLFYVWGHSYELVTEEDWEAFKTFCKLISNRDDICYCTNIEVLDFIATANR